MRLIACLFSLASAAAWAAVPTAVTTASENPVPWGHPVTVTVTVSGSSGMPTGTAMFQNLDPVTRLWRNLPGCEDLPLAAGVARCTVALVPFEGVVRGVYHGDATYDAVEATWLRIEVDAAGTSNVALGRNGAVASASSDYGLPHSSLRGVIDGSHRLATWGAGGGWEDATHDAYPDWLQVDFAGPRQVDRIEVHTVPDNEWSDQNTAQNYGIRDFTVEWWNGSGWTVAQAFTQNGITPRSVSWATPITTDRIRVVVTAANYFKSRLLDVKAWRLPSHSVNSWSRAMFGSTVRASSTYGPAAPASAAIDGDTTGTSWWEDATHDVFPDWIEVDLNRRLFPERVTLTTVRDDYGNPSGSSAITRYGITDYCLEGWDGWGWFPLQIIGQSDNCIRGNTSHSRTSEVYISGRWISKVRATILAANGHKSRVVELNVTGHAADSVPARANVALSSRGGVASASSDRGAPISSVTSLNDGDRSGFDWGSGGADGGGWEDATFNAYPDSAQIAFDGWKTIDHVVVYTLRDNFGSNLDDPPDAELSTLYGLTDFTVEGWNGSAWQVLGTVTGNTRVRRVVSFPPVTVDRIRVNVTASRYFKSRIVEIEAWGYPAIRPTSNVALASLGATASASSDRAGGFSNVAAIIDGDRSGYLWGSGGGWEDATFNAFPDWVQVDFGATRTIDRVDLYSLRDNFGDQSDPGEEATFSRYGITDFEVQAWDGAAWQTLATVTGNNLVRRSVSFPRYSTERIRIQVTNALYLRSRIVEVEAWGR